MPEPATITVADVTIQNAIDAQRERARTAMAKQLAWYQARRETQRRNEEIGIEPTQATICLIDLEPIQNMVDELSATLHALRQAVEDSVDVAINVDETNGDEWSGEYRNDACNAYILCETLAEQLDDMLGKIGVDLP